jgi:drug/metabolite transporter (DMT)-like permease
MPAWNESPMPGQSMSFKKKNILLHVTLLLVISALMGGLFPLIKITEQSITLLTLAMSRAVLAALVLLLVAGVGMKRDLTLLVKQWKTYATLGLILGVFFVLIAEAEEYIAASLASLLTCIIPISTFFITTLILHWERFTFARLGGSALALAGVAMFIGLEKFQFDQSQVTGVAISVAGSIIRFTLSIRARASSIRFWPRRAQWSTFHYFWQ